MLNFISLINNEFQEKISVLDRGFSYGDGFFETMSWRYLGGAVRPITKVEYWQRHYERIKAGCDLMQIRLPSQSDLIRQRQKILVRAVDLGMKEGILKLIITRGVGGRGYKFDNEINPTVVFLVFPKHQINPLIYDNGVKTTFCKTNLYSHNRLFGLKHMNRLDSVLARSEWGDEFFEGIFLDEKDNLVEGTMTNIFFIKGNTLITTPISNSGIDGIFRQVIIEKTDVFFNKINITKVNKKNLRNFDQMFLTNSILKVVPVKSLGNKKFFIGENLKKILNFFNIDKINLMKENLELF